MSLLKHGETGTPSDEMDITGEGSMSSRELDASSSQRRSLEECFEAMKRFRYSYDDAENERIDPIKSEMASLRQIVNDIRNIAPKVESKSTQKIDGSGGRVDQTESNVMAQAPNPDALEGQDQTKPQGSPILENCTTTDEVNKISGLRAQVFVHQLDETRVNLLEEREQFLKTRRYVLECRERVHDMRARWLDEKETIMSERIHNLEFREAALRLREAEVNEQRLRLDEQLTELQHREQDVEISANDNSQAMRRITELRHMFHEELNDVANTVREVAQDPRRLQELMSQLEWRFDITTINNSTSDTRDLNNIFYPTVAVDVTATNPCPICYEDYGGEDPAVVLKCCCKSNIGRHCLEIWLAENDTCPLCRNDFVQQGLIRSRWVAYEVYDNDDAGEFDDTDEIDDGRVDHEGDTADTWSVAM